MAIQFDWRKLMLNLVHDLINISSDSSVSDFQKSIISRTACLDRLECEEHRFSKIDH